MQSKLTLKLDADTIEKAKRYVGKQRGFSLSKLVENYFKSLTMEQEIDISVPPIVSSLSGVARKTKVKDLKAEYTEYLVEKYR